MPHFARSPADVQLRNGDELIIPKKNNRYVTVSGQVLNPYGRHLCSRQEREVVSQSGRRFDPDVADKSGTFVIQGRRLRDFIAQQSSAFWSGDPMSAVLKPGDSILVPEKAPRIGVRNWGTVLQAAQVASSLALTVAYVHP